MPFASNFAIETGRFFGVFLILDLAVPYLVDSQLYYYALTIGALVVNILCFYALIRRIFRSSDIAVLITALALAFLPNNWQHNPLAAYPFAYSIAMACLLGSFISFLRWRCGSGVVAGIVTAVLYFLALLTTEAFALYCTIFLCLSVTAPCHGGLTSHRLKCITRAFSPIAVSLSLYAVLYLLFKLAHPSHYEGVQLAAGNLSRTVAVVWQYATSTVPGWLFANIPAFGRDSVFDDVFPVYLDRWRTEQSGNGRFSFLPVDAAGWPLHGHLVWATAQWWQRSFGQAGFVRQMEVELALHEVYDTFYLSSARPIASSGCW